MLDILRAQMRAHPATQPADAVKLCYQSAFAGGHMIEDAKRSLAYLKEELAVVPPREEPLFEPIGGGYARLNLSQTARFGLSPETVNALFVRSAGLCRGTMRDFDERLSKLRSLCLAGGCPFTPQALDAYLTDYQLRGCPPVHHSEAYRAAYAPAYRVVLEGDLRFVPALALIDGKLRKGVPVTVAIDGRCGAGKSTLAALLSQLYDAPIAHMDDFFLPPDRKTPARLAEPGGNVDRERFQREVLPGLASGEPFDYLPYDCHAQAPAQEAVHMPAARVRIVEGVYSLHPDLAAAYNVKLFLNVSQRTQRGRIRQRSGEKMLDRFEKEWIPLEEHYFSFFSIEAACDITLHTD